MNVKILSLFLLMFVSLSFSGCSQKEYLTKVKEVKVPVKCVTPDVSCDFDKATYTEVITAMVNCLDRYKLSNKVCK